MSVRQLVRLPSAFRARHGVTCVLNYDWNDYREQISSLCCVHQPCAAPRLVDPRNAFHLCQVAYGGALTDYTMNQCAHYVCGLCSPAGPAGLYIQVS